MQYEVTISIVVSGDINNTTLVGDVLIAALEVVTETEGINLEGMTSLVMPILEEEVPDGEN